MTTDANDKQQILVTGASGFIGAKLVSRLRDLGSNADVVALARTDLDLADRDRVRTAFAAIHPLKVVHLAASVNRRTDDAATRRQWRDTFLAGRNVLLAAADSGAEHILAAGSLDELGNQGGTVAVDLPSRPATLYGLCKSLVRQVAEFVATTAIVRVDWFRPFTVYGPGQRGDMLVAQAFAAATAGTSLGFTDGTQERDFVFVDDIVSWIADGVAWNVPTQATGSLKVHHLGTARGTSVASVLKSIETEFPGARFDLGALSRRPGEPDCQIAPLPNERSDSWPWRPATDVADGLAATARWWRSLGAST